MDNAGGQKSGVFGSVFTFRSAPPPPWNSFPALALHACVCLRRSLHLSPKQYVILTFSIPHDRVLIRGHHILHEFDVLQTVCCDVMVVSHSDFSTFVAVLRTIIAHLVGATEIRLPQNRPQTLDEPCLFLILSSNPHLHCRQPLNPLNHPTVSHYLRLLPRLPGSHLRPPSPRPLQHNGMAM